MADSPPSTSTSTVFPIHQTGCNGPTCKPGHTHEANWDACKPECQAALDSSPTAIPTHFCPKAMRKHKFFGKKTSTAPKANDPFDYEQKYPEDEKYQELGAMARVWKVFLDECAKYDVEMAEDWRDTLDVLLVFAGLFSAVVTTFVSQTSQKLQRDFTEITAYKVDEVAALLRVAIAGNDITTIPPSSLSVSSKFVPERSTLWVNGLWFTSLALSLTTALLAVLTKQWIHQYMSVPSGTPRDRSRIRHYLQPK